MKFDVSPSSADRVSFPYLINRIRTGLYHRIFIYHPDKIIEDKPGIIISPEAIKTFGGFENACLAFAKSFRRVKDGKELPTRCCVVFNQEEAHYFEDGIFSSNNRPPSGGWIINTDFSKVFISDDSLFNE